MNMNEIWNQEKLQWDVIDNLLGTGVLASFKDRQDAINYCEEHENDINGFLIQY